MYISQIAEYLIWPAFILISWMVVNSALKAYDRKFPEKDNVDAGQQEG